MEYQKFSVEDFVMDSYFRHWVLSPSAESNQFWQNWLHQYPAKKVVLQEARLLILKVPRINYGWSSDFEATLWQSIVRDTLESPRSDEVENTKVVPLNADAMLGTSLNQPQSKLQPYYQISRVAATVVLLLGIGLAVYLGSKEPVEKPTPIVYLSKEVPLGAKETFMLPDGSRIMLNAGSTIYYPERFSESERLIEITGEAFLEVVKDRSLPFRVKTGSIVTEALGTAFNILYEQNIVEIALVEGKVQVSTGETGQHQEKLILLPGELASLQEDKSLVKKGFNTEKVTAWQEGTILFDNADEAKVIRTLEKWYGVTISTEGQASTPWHLSGKFKGKSLEYVLNSLSYSMDFSFTLDNKEVKITYP